MSCARLARDLGESLAGTAVHATGWLAVEHAGPWTPRAPTVAELGEVVDHLDVEEVRTQLIRRVRHPIGTGTRPGSPPGHTVLLGHAGPTTRWLERLHLADLRELLDLDPTTTRSPEPPGIGARVTDDIWLVCAHARRDGCCAVHGRPVAALLDRAGIETWETTHTGGHRFAATAIVLPDGLSLGRLDRVDPVATARDLAAGTLATELVRGRCGVGRPAQAAEVALRRHLDLTGRDEVEHVDARTRAGRTRVRLRADDTGWSITIVTRPVATARAISDEAEPTRPDEHVVERIEAA